MFQNTIVKKYISKIDDALIIEKYKTFRTIFANPEKQQNIQDSKEEQYQEGFLRDLFCSVLGYTINPEDGYNLITEKKNDSDSRKADGAIIIDGKVKAVIELKGCDTTDLSKIENQAFGYKAHNPGCRYVVISNFEKLRFYVDDASNFLEFNIFNLSKENFTLLYLCLALTQVTLDIPGHLKSESISEEKSITDKFYGDYSTFKRNLFEDIVGNNGAQYDKLILFKKTQKLLDRLLFILFCEDRGLLPENSILKTIDAWQQLKKLDAYQPLYERFKNYFNRMNTGYKSEDGTMDIFAYNGGLFKPDEILDNIKVGDDVLFIYSKLLAAYDFVSDVSVDILGHIFEHSLTEIEEIQNHIEEEKKGIKTSTTDISKRKKDGVFYTPAYITKYIVENTIGTLCEKKKVELAINESEYIYKCRKDKKEKLSQKLTEYRNWLLSLKICDPACGSGAFLNAALKYLMAEHTLIDELNAKMHGDTLIFQEIENSILEKNLFGVDINEESVEIAKLSLWLHTAQKGRKLTTLNNNIKCGNSLIDDPEIAGDKAFDWKKEFPQVFENGGFDVVIGNPPYVNMANIQDEKQRKFYQSNYKTVKNKCDLYSIFTEKAQSLLKQKGLLGFIFPNSWMGTESFSEFRNFLAHTVSVYKLAELPPGVFEDAIVTTVLCFYENTKPTDKDVIDVVICKDKEFYSKGFVLNYNQILQSPNTSFAFEKTISLDKVKTVELGEIVQFSLGIKTSDDNRFIFTEKKDDDCYLFLRGRNIKRWNTPTNNEYLWYKPELICEKPGGRPRVFENFVVDKKIVIQDMAVDINATLDCSKFLCNDKVNIIFEVDNKYSMNYILCLLNSKLVNTWFRKIYSSGLEIKINQLRTIPIPVSDISNESIRVALSSLADKMLDLNKQLQKQLTNFTRLLENNLHIEKLSTAFQNFYTLDFADFLKEVSKLKTTDGTKAKIALKDQAEWNDAFDTSKSTCQKLQSTIETTDKEINQLVYKLYGLTEEEIAVVEGR